MRVRVSPTSIVDLSQAQSIEREGLQIVARFASGAARVLIFTGKTATEVEGAFDQLAELLSAEHLGGGGVA